MTDLTRRSLVGASTLAAGTLAFATQIVPAMAQNDQSKATLDTAMTFMGAMGKGDMANVQSLMSPDMVWHNEGDPSLPWIGHWKGKEAVLGFLKTFSENLQTTAWKTENAFASGDTAAFFGTMNAKLIKSGKETGSFTFALRVKVKDGKIVFWNWFEDSFAVSKAYHGR